MKSCPLLKAVLLLAATPLRAGDLAIEDFKVDGPLGCQGAKVEKLGRNDFQITLGAAPKHPGWSNHFQFQVVRNAKGNDLRVTAVFIGETEYAFTGNFHSWSYNGKDWQRASRDTKLNKKDGVATRTMTIKFPALEHDTLWFGHQVPMTYEDSVELIEQWKKHPAVKVHRLGQSLGKRDLYRVEITDPASSHAPEKRWVHYFANQHPGEYNSMWRMVGMVDWLLSEAGADARRRSICHFVLMQSPDGPSAGWHRTNAQGIDMNRSYSVAGACPEQGHEPYIFQKDLEGIAASSCPLTTVWSMHTWPGVADPNMQAGPEELDALLGPPARLGEILAQHDPEHKLVKKLGHRQGSRPKKVKVWTPPLDAKRKPGTGYWNSGPAQQFGIAAFLCEGGGEQYTKKENLDSGRVLIQSLMEYYRGTKP